MLPKVAHYSGFQSYGDLPYSSLKPGQKKLESDTVFQATVRKEDELKLYNNTNRWTTLYDQNLSKTVQPEHYENPLRVTKQSVEKPLLATAGKLSTMKDSQCARRPAGPKDTQESFAAENKGLKLYNQTIASIKKDQADLTLSQTATSDFNQRSGDDKCDDYEFVQTGTEHWKTTYMAGIKDPYAMARATRPDWTLHKEPHSVQGGPRTSDYKGQFGERGTNPIQKLTRTVMMPPVPKSEEGLKLGTTLSSYHVPGYTGHIPKSLAVADTWDQALGVNTRTTIIKQNIIENYQTRVPGYSGHRPMNAVNDRGNLRQNCFSTAGERFH